MSAAINLTVGYIPYRNMAPFHQQFGPIPLQQGDVAMQFQTLSPRALGLEAEAGRIDAGALSLVDGLKLDDTFEPLGNFGIGVKRAAASVLLFSKKPMSELTGVCAVTDETATSIRLLEVLFEKRYNNPIISYGRIASSLLFDGEADALLLIGDEALRAKTTGIKGLPVITDLGEEWFVWQGTPFVFARWMVRKSLPPLAKATLQKALERSLDSFPVDSDPYLSGFCYRLTDGHQQSTERFKQLTETSCLKR